MPKHNLQLQPMPHALRRNRHIAAPDPALPPEAITAAVDELTRDRSAMNLVAANREVYLRLKEGNELNSYSSPYSPVHGHFSSEAQTTSASFRANTCRFAKAGGA